MMKRLLKPVWFVLAVLFLIEAWLWDHVGPLIGRMLAALPWRELKARIAAMIERLPPLATLIVFAVPAIVILPFKVIGVALIAAGHPLLGLATFALAKVVGFGITAFLFETCKPKLMLIPLFVRVYGWCQIAKAWAHERVDPIKTEIRQALARLREAVRRYQPEGGFFHRVWRLREEVRRRRLAAREPN